MQFNHTNVLKLKSFFKPERVEPGAAQALDGQAEGRAWMLPLLRQHVSGARLGFWGSELLPLARRLGARAAAAAAAAGAGGAKPSGAGAAQLAALQCRALEMQLWAALPAFASWPADGAQAFKCAPLYFTL